MNPESPPDAETLQRLWLFWTVYCCEKTIARRTGRPSVSVPDLAMWLAVRAGLTVLQVIDDDDIGCHIPKEVHSSSTLDPITLGYIIQSCQISSRICKKLMTAKSLETLPSKVLEIVNGLDKQLHSWKESLPVEMRPSGRLEKLHVSSNVTPLGITLIRCSYYDLLMVLHAPFSYPWISRRLNHHSNSEFRVKLNAQVTKSSQKVVDAARNIIITARTFEINGANTHA